MEEMNTTASWAAPALGRGVEILRYLDRESDSPLERIAAALPYPKPSIFRLLQTLAGLGLVEKTPEARYRALQVLRPAGVARRDLAQALGEVMEDLVRETGCTVEWFEAAPEGMILRRQVHPPHEVRVVARPGFVRAWTGELDAVALLGLAFAPGAPVPGPMRAYRRNGVLAPLPVREARARVAEARARGCASDPAFNAHGIRRSAAPVLVPGSSGVLAAAAAYQFGSTPSPAAIETPLRAAAQQLPRMLR
jgi:DNA-binding IclR family transcriptional regulator